MSTKNRFTVDTWKLERLDMTRFSLIEKRILKPMIVDYDAHHMTEKNHCIILESNLGEGSHVVHITIIRISCARESIDVSGLYQNG